ncbi:MAG: DUF362 domain-containing protein [Sphaerochaetaceae bacterium]|jgi:uncharacterized protein (DUF362 family)|nr:DUF362 domain-containing protein [Sphaerochaetaceae bacterium]NLO59456.1 DUF362 domain-containing protein [Spirochaetales bacterium]MDD2406336.1 DUF362 domain-containing protein [Sphaerochaetaceae bacterium]MDD4259127.1 DUF362 domain-containing protein [Sphaerochaetaceae bacterium]MDD4841294.1 DUF362 domain-containing protein [Sphaerochaetaceae bacterium]
MALDSHDIAIIYGSDARTMTRSLIEHADLKNMVSNRDAHIVIKPNLVVAKNSGEGATTHVEIVQTIVEYLLAHGFTHLSIAESAWVGDDTRRAFCVNGYEELSKNTDIPLIDVKRDTYQIMNKHGIRMEISKTIMDCDFLINIPVLKGHCQTHMTCALKNMKGCLSDRSKRQFHSMGLHTPIATLNSIRCANVVIVDSLNGDLDFEEGGNPVATNRMMIGRDSVLIDAHGARLLGFDIKDISYIALAEQFGVGSADITKANIVYLNKDEINNYSRPIGRARQLLQHVDERSACSACTGNLVHALARLDEQHLLSKLQAKISIGQEFKHIASDGIGIGHCTRLFAHSAYGCPPDALTVLKFLTSIIVEQ